MRAYWRWRALVIEHNDWVRVTVLPMVCRGKNEPVEDIVGIGRIAMIEAAKRYNPALGKFATYAFPRVKFAMLDALRRPSSGIDYKLRRALPESYADRPDPAYSPEELANHSAVRRKLLTAMQKLTPIQRDVVQSFIDGSNYEATASRYGRSKNWAFLIFTTAKKTLREELARLEITSSNVI